jgi:transposase InsO family protein
MNAATRSAGRVLSCRPGHRRSWSRATSDGFAKEGNALNRRFDWAEPDLFPYIVGFYNRQRPHSSLGYITPAEKHQLAGSQANVA